MIRTVHMASALPAADLVRRTIRATAASPVTWCALGFMSGAVFWHAVGFWHFVSQAVLEGHPAPQQTMTGRDSTQGAKRVRHEAGQTPAPKQAACAVLALNRVTGETQLAACPGEVWHHRHTGHGTRQDRQPMVAQDNAATGVAGWSTRLDELGADFTIR